MSFRRNHDDSGSFPAHGQKRKNSHISPPQLEPRNNDVHSDHSNHTPLSAPPSRIVSEPQLDMLLASVSLSHSLHANMNAASAASVSASAAADAPSTFTSASHACSSATSEIEPFSSSSASRRQKVARRDLFDLTLVLETGARVTVQMPPDQLLGAVFEHLREVHGRRYDGASTLLRYRGRTLNTDSEISDCTAPPLPRRCVLHVVPLPQHS